jgi:SynChlorMet cassette radical SAM/SPASM protein ScmF
MPGRYDPMTLCDVPEEPVPVTTGQPARIIDLPEGVPPLRAFYLYLTSTCNLRCRHCWIAPEHAGVKPKPGQYIDLDALRGAITEAKTLGLASAKLTGGEPMHHPQFREIVELLTAEGISLNMETNGTLMTKEMAHFLKEKSKVGFVSVSLDSPVPAEHDAFRGVKGACEAALRGLDFLVEAGYTNCQVIMAVHHGNRHQMEELVKLAASHKAATVKFNPVTRTGRGIQMHEKGEALNFEEYLELARYVDGELRPKSPVPVIMSMPPALVPFSELWRTKGKACDCGVAGILGILGGGEIALCGIGQTIPELVYGHLGKDSIRDIWHTNPVILGLREDLKNVQEYPGICGSCIHAKSCRTGCVANNYGYGGKLVSPPWLCDEAARKGVFPESRMRGIPQDIEQELS